MKHLLQICLLSLILSLGALANSPIFFVNYDSVARRENTESSNRLDKCPNMNLPVTAKARNGDELRFLGMALVYMPAAYNTSKVGHLGSRFLYCRRDRLVDFFFDSYLITGSALRQISTHYPELQDIEKIKAFYKENDGKFFIELIRDPATIKFYGVQQLNQNRNIRELWLKLSSDQIYQAFLMMMDYLDKQDQNINNNVPLDEYKILGLNCTHPLKNVLNTIAPNAHQKLNAWLPRGTFQDIRKSPLTAFEVFYPSWENIRNNTATLNDNPSDLFEEGTLLGAFLGLRNKPEAKKFELENGGLKLQWQHPQGLHNILNILAYYYRDHN